MKTSIGPKPFLFAHPDLIIGTYDPAGRPNVMAAAWGGICSSSPVSVAVSVQKSRYTYGNIMERHAFTISIPSEEHAAAADFFGMVSGEKVDKFAATGLTPVPSDIVDAPYVGEFPVVLECRLSGTVEIGIHTQFIGEILDVKVDDAILGEDGKPDIGRIRPFVYNPASVSYHRIAGPLGKAFSIGRKFKK